MLFLERFINGGSGVSEEILINSTPSETRVALVESGMLQEVWLERASHTGYIGNLKSINLEKQLEQHPERVIQSAVKGMLPRNPLGRAMFRKLHVYAGPDHPHAAQQPKALDI